MTIGGLLSLHVGRAPPIPLCAPLYPSSVLEVELKSYESAPIKGSSNPRSESVTHQLIDACQIVVSFTFY